MVIRRGHYRLETLRAQLNYERGVLRLQGLQMADARGKLSASGEFTPATGEARFQLDSGLDLPAIAREFFAAGESLLAPFTFHDAPRVRIDDGRVRLASGHPDRPALPTPAPVTTSTVPKALPARAIPVADKPAPPGLQFTGHLSLGRWAYRGLEFERAETDFSWSDGRWYLRGLHLARPVDGDQQITADVLSEPGTCRVRLNSSLDPTAFAALLPARGRTMLGEWKFQDAPRIELNATGTSLDDPESFRADGSPDPRAHALSRGKPQPAGSANSPTATTRLATGISPLNATRAPGRATCSCTISDATRRGWKTSAPRSTRAQVAVWIDPDVARAVAPYHFRKPPATVTNGVVQFDGGRNSRLTVEVNAPGGMEYTFIHRPLVFQSVAGQVLFTDDRLRLNDMRGEIFGGQMRGSLDLVAGPRRAGLFGGAGGRRTWISRG